MSQKTPNLGLSLVDMASEAAVNFRDWSREINSEDAAEEGSAFQKIDNFAGHIYGRSGELTLLAADWDATTKTCVYTVKELGATDAIFFAPKTEADQEQLNKMRCSVTAKEASVSFSAKVLPEIDIQLTYFISRGK